MKKSTQQRLAPHLKGPGFLETVKGLINPLPKMFDVLQIEVSSTCPASCTYCPHTTMADEWKNALISPQTYAAAWPLFRQAGRVHLQGWGEPFLHPQFFDFVELARRADCQVSTTSCGLIMNEALALKIVKSGLDVVAFSLAGVTAAGNASRAGAPFDKVCTAIKLLQKVRKEHMAVHLELHIAYMVLASQIDEMYGLPDLLDELDIHAAVVSTMDFVPSKEMAHEAFMPHEQEKIAKARTVLEEISKTAQSRGREIFYSLPKPEPRNTCLEHIERSLYIAADGAVSPCIYVNLPTTTANPMRRVYGNINNENPLDIWNKPEYAAFRSNLANATPDLNCQSCPKRYAVGNRE
ncbi:radical SAM protein [Desulfovibrio sp. OttesenSCG-928-F07]|nr:radical SAM protein [Desulfovibrio sp. OttesenSCG-928-F07]